ncbi:MAG: hypothetical protein DRO39_09010 [Thermoprotei archaeon]|nr:MAG: hypothetical protein DRO39_09010 [Thermoprotei archaeon]
MLDRISEAVPRNEVSVIERGCRELRLPNGKVICVKEVLQVDGRGIVYVDEHGRVVRESLA